MNKRYMDFVPTKSKKAPVLERKTTVAKVEETSVRKIERKVERAPKVERPSVPRVERIAPKKVEKKEIKREPIQIYRGKEPVLGVVEDLDRRIVGGNVTKRPLNSQPHFSIQRNELKEAKEKRVVDRAVTRTKEVVREETKEERKDVLKTPRTPFINQEKVIKRPLSKNVYQKKVETPKEEPKGPVTIITKPEKDAHAGLIVAIIITIILGAAAGTVAFLLLQELG